LRARKGNAMKSQLFCTFAILMLMACVTGSRAQKKGIDPVLLAKAKAGDATAQFKVGNDYGFAVNVPQNNAQAIFWYRKSAGQGNADAQNMLGYLYDSGYVSDTRDAVLAATWYRKAAEQGNSMAQYNLGIMYNSGDGVPQDYTQAAIWYHKAAEQGNLYAQYNLGISYYKGQGVPQDYVQSVICFRKAADHGIAEAQAYLGWLYALGQGVKKSYVEAAIWDRKAADQGDSFAQKNLADLYDNGGLLKVVHDPERPGREKVVMDEDGGPFLKDKALAAIWYRKAADQGDAGAQNDLGLLYDLGHGVPQDYVEAYFWYSLASAKSADYTGNRDGAASHLSSAILLKTQERARKWFEDHPAKP
jgi:TPR repeat protein